MKKQHGAALITVMLIVFIVMSLVTDITVTNYRTIKKLINLRNTAQSFAMLSGTIDFGRAGLATSGATSKIDTLQDVWAEPFPKVQVLDNIDISGYITDENSKFNINDLISNGNINKLGISQLARLFNFLNVPQNLATSIAYYITSPSNQSSILNDYVNGTPAYMPSGRQITDLSELLLVKGMTSDILTKIYPYITAISNNYGIWYQTESASIAPTTSTGDAIITNSYGTSINVNTSTAEVIAAKTNIDLGIAQRLVTIRDQTPFTSTQDIISFLTKNGVNFDVSQNTDPYSVDTPTTAAIDVKSFYFTIHVLAENDDRREKLVALTYRANRQGQWPIILWQHSE